MLKHLLVSSFCVLISAASFAAIEDVVLVDPADTGKKWTAETVKNHEVWNKPACVAYTMSDDGLSSLEVVAYYNQDQDKFLEPEVNVITPFDVSFFEVLLKGDGGSAKTFSLLPVLPSDESLVGARTLFIDDREALVSQIRKRNRMTARFIDTAGEVKEIKFSLSGSSNAIREQFKACALEFNGLPEELEVLPELK